MRSELQYFLLNFLKIFIGELLWISSAHICGSANGLYADIFDLNKRFSQAEKKISKKIIKKLDKIDKYVV